MARRPWLRMLAGRAGIITAFHDMHGRQRRTTDATREALLAAMGFDASTESAAARSLAALDREAAARMLPAARIMTGAADHITIRIPPLDTTHVERARPGLTSVQRDATDRSTKGGRARRVLWSVDVSVDDSGHAGGDRSPIRLSGEAGAVRPGATLRIALPYTLGIGCHRVCVRVDGLDPATLAPYSGVAPAMVASDQDARRAEQLLVVAPRACVRVEDKVGQRRVFGLVVNLWGVRSAGNAGAGDTRDLRALVDLAADAGADFVGMNPLHALRNRGVHISPYSPISRLFRNPLYIDVAAVPESSESGDARRLLDSPAMEAGIARLRLRERVDYKAVMRVKDSALDALYATFVAHHRGRDTQRGRDFAGFLDRQGPALTDFATFLALDAHFAQSGRSRDWQRWPAAFRDPRSPEVRAFREANAVAVDRHAWVQFELDRQLGDVAGHAHRRGMQIGLYPDLAIGSAAGGSDAWSFPGLFVNGASLGAPPDDYSATGQDWSLPPLHPLRLADTGYHYWMLLLRNALAHAGALRIDHVMGLFRQFWIPAGRPGNEGAYVSFPASDLLAILALESHRHNAVIIGEDLGTVPSIVPPALRDRAILSSRVMYYERDRRGRFKPSARYSNRALVTANTHDNAPIAGFWAGRDLELRRRLGTLPARDHALALRQRSNDRAALLARLIAERVLPAGTVAPDATTLCAAVHRYLARTPSPLLGVALDDVTAEVEPANVPGITPDRYPSWTRRQRIPLEHIAHDPHALAVLGAVRERAPDPLADT